MLITFGKGGEERPKALELSLRKGEKPGVWGSNKKKCRKGCDGASRWGAKHFVKRRRLGTLSGSRENSLY